MASSQPSAPVPPHSINLIDENNTRGMLFTLLKEVADPRRSDPNKHFHKIGTTNTEERHIRLTRNGACEQGLPGTWWPHEEYPFRDFPSQLLKALRIFQEINDFL